VDSDVRHIFRDKSGEGAAFRDRPPTVLVVEDDGATRSTLASWLTGKGFVVRTAGSGFEAVKHLLSTLEPIDVVLLDVGLPDVNGVVLYEALQELSPWLPVVCTGQATAEEETYLRAVGARGFFRKPVDPDELLSAVEKALP
jgi:DNA-binding NtrC family response regulator